MDKSFVMLVGLPGAGKSTMAVEKYAADPDAVVITSDTILEGIAADKNITYAQAFAEHMGEANAACFAQAREAFAAGKKVVWDQTNLSIDDRARKLALVPDDYFKTAFAFELSKDELADRFIARFHETGKAVAPESMDKMAKSYERPGRFEGFDYVEVITE
jgi:predicted kinase